MGRVGGLLRKFVSLEDHKDVPIVSITGKIAKVIKITNTNIFFVIISNTPYINAFLPMHSWYISIFDTTYYGLRL
jgi:hypothetical protein